MNKLNEKLEKIEKDIIDCNVTEETKYSLGALTLEVQAEKEYLERLEERIQNAGIKISTIPNSSK